VDLDGVRWRKSSWSSGQDEENSNCVEVAMIDTAPDPVLDIMFDTDLDIAVIPSRAAVRDSKNPGPTLVFPPSAWSNLVHRLVC
jgi:hypothetical protein